MKNRFGNVTYDSTLSQGLGPLLYTPDTLAQTVSFSFEFQNGIELYDTISSSLPSVISSSLTTTVAYINIPLSTDTVSSALPEVLSASLVSVVTYVESIFDVDTVSSSLPTIISASLTTVVRIHELYDAVLSRPEDTIEHTTSWEFTLT